MRAGLGAAPGRYFVAARIRDEHGQVIEDTVMVAIGERRWPDAELPAEEALEVMQADFMAAAAEVELAVATPELRIVPGGRGEIRVSVTSQLASAVHGEAQLVSPFGSWEMLSPPAQGFSATRGRARGAAFRGRRAGHGPARRPVVGAGQGDVFRPGPVQPGHTGQHRGTGQF